ncbi:DUF3291 domain-containing protein [Ruegeria atlantica]|uniref:DUF3291 domain-containing protein n=1 Tax=Ruegeria atlantica TaxID=81569 RepID=UPI00147EB150|nr:DUF3291 domain-containing protein [Ruegeria atlantica]
MLAAIGGVSLKRWYYAPEFHWRAHKALNQARGDPLCLHAGVFSHQEMYFSLSVWHDAEAMLTFAYSGPHRQLMQAAERLADLNGFYHFPCLGVPSRDQALQVWELNYQAAG